MTEIQEMALSKARKALAQGRPSLAAAWAEAAAHAAREAQLTQQQERDLIAPIAAPTSGDMAVVGVTVLVFVWLLADMIGRFL